MLEYALVLMFIKNKYFEQTKKFFVIEVIPRVNWLIPQT